MRQLVAACGEVSVKQRGSRGTTTLTAHNLVRTTHNHSSITNHQGASSAYCRSCTFASFFRHGAVGHFRSVSCIAHCARGSQYNETNNSANTTILPQSGQSLWRRWRRIFGVVLREPALSLFRMWISPFPQRNRCTRTFLRRSPSQRTSGDQRGDSFQGASDQGTPPVAESNTVLHPAPER